MLPPRLTDQRWLLRPGVSFVHIGEGVYDFFQASTRRTRRLRLSDHLRDIVQTLDGTKTPEKIIENKGDLSSLNSFLTLLNEYCLIETSEVRGEIDKNKWRRVLNFMGDYFPCIELFNAFERVQSARVLIFGAGAIGSWIAIQLAHSGIRNFALVDDDTVGVSNLNRSLYTLADIDQYKVDALASRLHEINPETDVQLFRQSMSSASDCLKLLEGSEANVAVNAADQPSVDETSRWVDAACQEIRIPYVIAGGYNLHLSIIGMTVIPGSSACFKCGELTLKEQENRAIEGVRRLWRPKRNIGNLSPLAATASSFSASEVFRLAARSERMLPAMLNRRGEFNFLTNTLSFVDLPRRSECGCQEV